MERSFGNSREWLTSLNDLTRGQLEFKDRKTLLQLRDCALAVAERKNEIAISEMFSTELKFAADCLLKWFNKKFKSNNLELSDEQKRKYEINHPINWKQGCCCLCPFLLEINPKIFDADEKTVSYTDVIICKELQFLRKNFSNDELSKTDAHKDLKTFNGKFVRFLRVAVFLQNAFTVNDKFDACFDDDLLDFCKNNCADCSDFGEIKDLINYFKIKNSKSCTKIPKFTLQTYAFAYQRLMDFLHERLDYETLTTLNFFESIHEIINVKIHLHHLHVTGKIIGYAHDFCNMKVRENQNQSS